MGEAAGPLGEIDAERLRGETIRRYDVEHVAAGYEGVVTASNERNQESTRRARTGGALGPR